MCKSIMKFSSIVLFLAIFLYPAGALAEDEKDGAESTTVEMELQQVIDKYELKHVNSVPKGIEPIPFKDAQELESLIQTFQNDINYTVSEPTSSISPDVTYAIVTRSCSVNAGGANLNVIGDIRVGYEGSFRWVDSVNTRVTFTGVTFGLGMRDPWSYHNVTNGTSVSVTGGATIDIYLISEIGGIVLYSQEESCSFNYSLY